MKEKFGISTKKYMLKELKEKFRFSEDFIITNYKGLSTLEIEQLKKLLSRVSSKYFVVKNSIVKRILDEMNLKDINQSIEGETGISFAGDAIKASRVLVNFAKQHGSFKVSLGFIAGKKETKDRIKYLAELPSREVLLANAASCMKSPITGFVGVLNGLLRKFVVVIGALKEKRESYVRKNGG